MTISEAVEALEVVNQNVEDTSKQFHLTDFTKKNGKLVMKADLREKYVKAQLDSIETEYNRINDEIKEFTSEKGEHYNELKNLSNKDNIPSTISSETLKLLNDLQLIEKDAEGNLQFIREVADSNLSVFDIISEKLIEKSANYKEVYEYAKKEIPAAAALEAGNYKEYLKNVSSLSVIPDLKDIANGKVFDTDYGQIEFSYEKLKPVIESINSKMNTFITDALDKGIENLHFEDYDFGDIMSSEEFSNIQKKYKDNYTRFIQDYGEWFGDTLEDQNALMIQAIEKDTQSTIGAEDALKNVNFLKSDLAYASMDTLQSLADSLHVAVKTLFNPADYDAALGGYKVDMAALATNGLNEIINSSNIVADSVKAFLDSISEGIGKGLEGKLGFAERDNLISNLGKYGMELDAADFTRTADGLKLSEQKAIELYNTLKQIDSISADRKSVV